jgi:hypothetical protein
MLCLLVVAYVSIVLYCTAGPYPVCWGPMICVDTHLPYSYISLASTPHAHYIMRSMNDPRLLYAITATVQDTPVMHAQQGHETTTWMVCVMHVSCVDHLNTSARHVPRVMILRLCVSYVIKASTLSVHVLCIVARMLKLHVHNHVYRIDHPGTCGGQQSLAQHNSNVMYLNNANKISNNKYGSRNNRIHMTTTHNKTQWTA